MQIIIIEWLNVLSRVGIHFFVVVSKHFHCDRREKYNSGDKKNCVCACVDLIKMTGLDSDTATFSPCDLCVRCSFVFNLIWLHDTVYNTTPHRTVPHRILHHQVMALLTKVISYSLIFFSAVSCILLLAIIFRFFILQIFIAIIITMIAHCHHSISKFQWKIPFQISFIV